MKSTHPTSQSFPSARRTLVASAVILLFDSAGLLAQSSSPGSSTYGTGQKHPTTSSSNADVKSTEDINATSGTSTTSTGKLSWGDRRFVTKAADEGMDEVALAQLAAQRATNSEVRNYAQKLATEHEAVNSELTQIASQKNVKIENDAEKDRAYKRLNKKTGAEFDQEFVEHMIDEHEKDLKMFEKAASDAKDPEVKAFAAKHVDSLRDHLQQAQSLRQTLMPTGRMDTSSGRTTPSSTDTSTGTRRDNTPR